ncbi:MAG: hypothetical protein A2122_02090 [Candidatus Liptonbacteria bacterium GWB1_49_6]|uniref:Uncharacterized protein n=1 Tax=Candidatus Liptonbacteria bacterium GWB1_49_6 TaxID=1798644 RepID=A0A1G2C4I7_9BACT|nr:MAG: hypothetical protein A2122_02090 [Candidatus Liptonbacteria bacterium GWB1_49_6]
MFGMIGRLLQWISKESLFGVVGASVVEGGKSIFGEAKRVFMEDMTKQAPPEDLAHLAEKITNLSDDTARTNLTTRLNKRIACIPPFTYGDADKMKMALLSLLQGIKNPSKEEEILKTLGRANESDFDAVVQMIYTDPKFVAFVRKSWALLKESSFVFWKQANAVAGNSRRVLKVLGVLDPACHQKKLDDFRTGRVRRHRWNNLFIFPW